ncbi:hypothetical protein B0O99DRAFT_621107 [Bisporella sp. PMI_857]|nr:hypothetical protein B0O99DRAFT_621107 [Bisporella sp. PMI_857]
MKSSTNSLIYFMYHHYQHCSIGACPPPPIKSRSSFTLFPLLPPELRLKIWEMIASEPQTVELSCTPTSSYLPDGRWFSHNKAPILFSICSESRAVAFAEYEQLKFSPGQMGSPWDTIYVNWERDTLWLCNDLWPMLAKDLLRKNEQLKDNLKKLAIGRNLWRVVNQNIVMYRTGASALGLTMDGVDSSLKNATTGLKALADIKFHS